MKHLLARASFWMLCSIVLLADVAARGQDIQIDPLSPSSLLLQIKHNDTVISSATGFVVQKGDKYYLITNRHVVLQCAEDRDPSDVGGWICADKLAILHNKVGRLGMEWFTVTEELFEKDGKTPRWLEHPTLHGAADIIALPLATTENVQFYPLDVKLARTDLAVAPGDTVSIVGFPFGQPQQFGLPIWKTGTVASDLDVEIGSKPMFLLDTTSRPGMSGSPVYAVRFGMIHRANGQMMNSPTRVVRFLGIYSQQNLESELGGVWKASAVIALYDSLP